MLTQLAWAFIWIESFLLLFSFCFICNFWSRGCAEFQRSAFYWFVGHSIGLTLFAYLAALNGALIQ